MINNWRGKGGESKKKDPTFQIPQTNEVQSSLLAQARLIVIDFKTARCFCCKNQDRETLLRIVYPAYIYFTPPEYK